MLITNKVSSPVFFCLLTNWFTDSLKLYRENIYMGVDMPVYWGMVLTEFIEWEVRCSLLFTDRVCAVRSLWWLGVLQKTLLWLGYRSRYLLQVRLHWLIASINQYLQCFITSNLLALQSVPTRISSLLPLTFWTVLVIRIIYKIHMLVYTCTCMYVYIQHTARSKIQGQGCTYASTPHYIY